MIRNSEWRRAPSLRELRANRPDNVEILPTAQQRQVTQKYNQQSREAKLELRRQTQERFDYLHPDVRAQLKRAERLAANRPETARDRLLDTLVQRVLTDEQRKALIADLERSDDQTSLDAIEIVRLALPMPLGEEFALRAAFEVLASESDEK